MRTRLLIIIGIVLASVVLVSSVYVISVQNRCESLLGDTHYPRPLTLWNCLNYLQMVDNPPPKSISEPITEHEPDYESLQQQKKQEEKLRVQEIVLADTRGIENKIPAIKEYRDEFESGYFLEQFIIPNKQNFEKGQVIHFIFGEWGFQPTENTSSKVTVYFRSYDNYDKIEKINEWKKPNDSTYLSSPDSDGYLMIDFHGMAPTIGTHEECVIPGEYRVSASNSGDKSKLEWGYFTCQRDKLVGEAQPWIEIPE